MGGGGFIGGSLGNLLSMGTLGLTDALGITGSIKEPETVAPSAMAAETGNVIGGGSGKTLDLTEQDKQRGSVTKKRLGTKQLQIPLANQASAGINVAPTTGTNI